MTSWISIDDRIKYGLKVVDQIENTKLRLLVSRICQSLQAGINENIFNEEELEKLSISLNLEKDDLNILLSTIILVFTQAAFHLVKSDMIENLMKKHFSIGNDKVAILSHAWITHAKGIINALKHKSIFPTQLADISWSVDIKVASSALAREAKPFAKLQLNLENCNKSRLTVEMDKNQLWDLYHKLDDIQSQLDSLKKEK